MLTLKRFHINRFIIAYAVVLMGLAVFGYYHEIYAPKAEIQKIAGRTNFATDLTYYDLPRISMNLKSASATSRIRIDISLEVAKKDARRLEDFRSRITDSIITYLYKQKVEKMRPPNDIAWLHREILDVINTTNQPVVVHDVIFRELVVM